MSDTRLQTSLDQVLSIPSVKAEHLNLHADAIDELATLRAQLAEANEIIYHMCNDVENNYIYIKSFVDAKNYIGKVKSA